jgi:hypothetical protein
MSNNSAPPVRKHGSFSGRIGIARADITPPVGIYARNWGAARHDVAESIHCPSTLSVLTLARDAASAPLVLVDGDLGWWRPLNKFDRFRERLLQETSLKSSQLIFALSHTHASAPLMDPDPALPGSDLLEPWHETIFQATVQSIREALAGAFDGTLDWHVGRCGLAANRDLPDPDPKKDRILCGYNPAGEPDDTLLVGRITDAAGTLRGTLVNYACHPTVLAWENTSLSPDYPGALRSTMEAATGATAFFLQGMSGDLAPRYQYVGVPRLHPSPCGPRRPSPGGSSSARSRRPAPGSSSGRAGRARSSRTSPAPPRRSSRAGAPCGARVRRRSPSHPFRRRRRRRRSTALPSRSGSRTRSFARAPTGSPRCRTATA